MSRYLKDVNEIWSLAMQTVLLADDSFEGELAHRRLDDLRSVEQGRGQRWYPNASDRYYAFIADNTPSARVSRLQVASPLEAVLTGIATGVRPVGYALGGMIIVERIFRLVMEWQRHRADLADREPPATPPELLVISSEDARRLATEGGLSVPLRSANESAANAISGVGQYYIIEVRQSSV
ncbi:hypothetical protein ACPXB1_22520 [Micromonospora sp. DT68]|uniref:hypothetical protein n=1 Tax=Micromonospora sp. DT68 TaxID=3416522 RepID=UPI003CF5D9FC